MPLDNTVVTIGIFVCVQAGTLIYGAATMKAQLAAMRDMTEQKLSGMQAEIERQGRVLETFADVRAELRESIADLRADIKFGNEVRLAQGRRLDDLTAIIIGKPVAAVINEAKGIT